MRFLRNDNTIYHKDLRISQYSDPDKTRSDSERKLYEIVKDIYPRANVFIGFPIEVRLGKTLYYDVYLPQLKIAFEYDGAQHKKYNSFFHTNRAAFVRQKRNDSEKDIFSENNEILLIRISGIVTKDIVVNKIQEAFNE